MHTQVARYESELEAQVLVVEGMAAERDSARAALLEAESSGASLAAEVSASQQAFRSDLNP